MSDVEGFILAGGKSSRMGTDKAHLTIEGKSFLERAAHTLSAIADRIYVVGDKRDDSTSLPIVPDVFKDWGALGGVHAALFHCKTPWAAILACDLPLVTPELMRVLNQLRD